LDRFWEPDNGDDSRSENLEGGTSHAMGKECTVSQLEEDLYIKTKLRDTVIAQNKIMNKDKEFKRLSRGPVVFEYPGNTITFGFEKDPRSMQTYVTRKPGIIYAESESPNNRNLEVV